MCKRKKEFVVYLIIIILQLLTILYWASIKGNYYIDELYSKGYASSFTGGGDTAQYITTGAEWRFNEWVSNDEYKHHIMISEEESVFHSQANNVVKKFISGRNYFGFLNIAESLYGYNTISAFPGIALNVFFLICSEIMLISFLKKLNVSTIPRYLSIMMFGFSAFVISMVEYIRFYMLVTLYLLMMLNLLLKAWKCDNAKSFFLYSSGVFFLGYLSYKDSEFTILILGAIISCFFIALLLGRKWSKLLILVTIGILASIYILTQTDYVGYFLNPYVYTNNNAALIVSKGIHNANINTIVNNVQWIIGLFSEYYFGSNYLPIFCIVSIIVFLIVNKHKGDNILEKKAPQKLNKIIIGDDGVFVIILIAASMIYSIVIAAMNIPTWRYYAFGFVLIIVIFWFLIDRIIKVCVPNRALKGTYTIIAVFVLVSCSAPFYLKNIEYNYASDRELTRQIEPFRDMDTVLISSVDIENPNDPYGYSRHETYDCVLHMSDFARIYAVDVWSYSYEETDYPNEFLLWSHVERDISAIVEELLSNGYTVDKLGINHISQVYICRS